MTDCGQIINMCDTAHCRISYIAHNDAYMSYFIICLKFLKYLESFRDWPYPQEFPVITLGP